MKHIVLICHKDHFISGSVNFIKKLFEKEFQVDVLTDHVSVNQIKSLVNVHDSSVFVLWQMEYLAPWLVSKGLKVVVFPMYDGCGTAPNSYFKVLDRTYLFNFSKRLHKKCIGVGVTSYQLNYYPEIKQSNKIFEKKEKLFYWLRRPDSSLAEPIITKLFAPYIENIHIHDRQDAYDIKNDVFQVEDDFISTSIWFDEKEKLETLIATSKYYLAPRESEGIGMAFLEAMSLGCIVFANKNSTHDQYIYHGYNGFLIDFESQDIALIKAQLKEAFDIIKSGKQIGENAKNFINKGVPIWNEQSKRILETLNTISDAKKLKRLSKKEQLAGFILVKLYRKHYRLYFIIIKIFYTCGLFSDKVLKFKFNIIYRIIFKLLKTLKR